MKAARMTKLILLCILKQKGSIKCRISELKKFWHDDKFDEQQYAIILIMHKKWIKNKEEKNEETSLPIKTESSRIPNAADYSKLN